MSTRSSMAFVLVLACACSGGGGTEEGKFFGPSTGNDGSDTSADGAGNEGADASDAADGSEAADGMEGADPSDGADEMDGTEGMDGTDLDAATPSMDGDASVPGDGMSGGGDAGTSMDASTPAGDAGVAVDAGSSPDAGTATGDDAGSEPPLDAGQTLDAGQALDAGLGTNDDGGAPVADGGSPSEDAGSAAPDAGGAVDAGAGVDAGETCGTDAVVAGNSCAGVVTCQDNNLSGDPVLECVLTGPSPQRCCTNTIASNSCRTTACGGGDDEAKCDGPEDCGGSAGLCCFDGGATSCAASCGNVNRLCHTNADCPSGSTCEAGRANGQYSWWGFCT